eukprot:COSAG02_NODE_49649_length_325_cov_1.026549_1_plen_68_part_10
MSGESSSLPHRISGGLSPASLILAAAVVGWLSVYQHSAAELLTVPVFEEDELGGHALELSAVAPADHP